MGYTGNTWVNNSTPAISAENLNKMEKGIRDAHTGVEEAKLLANTNTIVLNKTLEFTTSGRRYKLPIDDFSFDKYWIFGWTGTDNSCWVNTNDNEDSKYAGEGWFEGHKSGILAQWIYYNPTFHNVINIDNNGILTATTNKFEGSDHENITMCIIPVSKKNIIEL